MDINATLLGQTIAFLVFVVFCYKFIWPPIIKAINSRQQEIADSIEQASKAREEVLKAKDLAEVEVNKARERAKEIIAVAENQANQILDQAQIKATEKSNELLENARKEIALERTKAQSELRNEVASIAVSIAEKIVEREISAKDNLDIIDHALSNLDQSK